MLVTFKSKAASDVVMYKEHAKLILNLVHKDLDRGVITAAETANAVHLLDAAIAESKVHSAAAEMQHDVHAHHGEFGDDNEHEPKQSVSFAVRVFPLLEMLRAAQKGGNDVMWGV